MGSNAPDTAVEIATSILNSRERMNRMVNDHLDLTRTRLGSGIPVILWPMELATLGRQMIEELKVIYPNLQIQFQSKGDLHREWDHDGLPSPSSWQVAIKSTSIALLIAAGLLRS